jgi:hypothetical protein
VPSIKIFVHSTVQDFGQLDFVKWLGDMSCIYGAMMLVIAFNYFTFRKVWYQAHIYSCVQENESKLM